MEMRVIRAHWRSILLFALGYYLLILLIEGVIFVFSHLPPRVVHLDSAILKLAEVESLLLWPWRGLLWLWGFMSEKLPRPVSFMFKVCNSLFWGVILVGFREVWRKIRT